jgi:hypothetical protein
MEVRKILCRLNVNGMDNVWFGQGIVVTRNLHQNEAPLTS